MRKHLWKVIAILVIAAAAFFAWKKFGKGARDGKPSYQEATVTQGAIENSIEASGEVAPLNRVEIKPPVGGRIEKILTEEGSSVKAGQILAWMSSSDRAAVIDAARAKGPEELKKWQDAYQPTPIVAPLSGVIILRNVVIGQTIDVSTVLFALSDKLIVLAHVDEVDIGRIRDKMPAHIVLDSFPQDSIDGQVTAILYEGKNVSNVITYGVKVEPKNAPAFFRSQMTANVRFIIEQKENALLVPSNAIQTTPNGDKQVLVPGAEGQQPQPVPVKVGADSGGNTEILAGLNAGDTILIQRKRYSPQRGNASSPLVMGGRPGGNNSGGGNRRGGGSH